MKTRSFNIRKLGIKLLSGFALVSSFAMSSYAQVANYSFTQSSGTYTPITGGTIVGQATSANPSASPENLPMDDYTYRVALPFSFAFNGAAYDSININTNGWASFGTNTSSTSTPISSTATYSGVIAAFAHDQMGIFATRGITTSGSPTITNVENTSRCVIGAPIQGTNIPANATIVSFTNNSITISANATGTSSSASYVSFATGVIRMQAIGTAPNRTIVIQFSGMAKYSGSADAATNNTSFDYQIRLSETSNIVSVVYGSFLITATNSYTSQVGLRGATSTDYNNRASTTTWSGTTAGTANNSSVTWNNTINPASGQTFIWTPPTCFIPGNPTASAATNSGATIRWTKPVPNPSGYEYYISTTNTAPTAATPATGPATDSFKVISGLPSATTHYVWVRSSCGTSDKSAWTSSATFTTLCGTPAPGATIASNNANLCAGAIVKFSLTTIPTGPGLSYLWQSSLDGVNYTSITGATDTTFSTNVTAAYYRCRVVCSGGPDTVYSTPVQLNYANAVTATTAAQRCGAGSVTLNATPSTGAIINWYDVASGGTSLGTGTSFTTPVIANTTAFYAEAAVVTQGQPAVTIGSGASTGTGTSYNLTQGTYGGLKVQYIIRASELTAAGFTAGNITSLGFELTATGSSLGGFTIQMGNTTLTEFATSISLQSIPNTVYTSTLFTPVVGVNNFAFSSPYNWDGLSNIIISISWSNNNSSNDPSTIKYDSHSGYMSQMHRRDNQTAAFMLGLTGVQSGGSSNRSQNRPMFILNNQPVVCASSRSAVTATINTAPVFTITNNKTVCNNGITPLTVTSTQSSYNNVTWSPATGLFTDAAATVPYVANTHAYTVYHKSNVVGSEEYIATAQNTSTLCGGIDTVTLQIIPPAITAIATPGVLCHSGSSVIKINPAIPQTGELYQWQSSNDNVTFTDIGSIVSADTLATGTLTATKYFRAIVKNSDSVSCFNSTADTVVVNTPVLTSTTPASRCGLGTVILQAAANSGAMVNWYTTASGGTAIATGNAFTTPVITANTNYYVSADFVNTVQATGARPAPASTSNTAPSDYGLVFNANQPFTLNSVEVYNNGSAGIVTIRLVNSNGTVLQTLNSFNVPAGNGTTPFTVPLNFSVPQGTDLRLMALSGTASLVREGSVGGFPYTVGDIATITNGYVSSNNTTYYYFYNWKITKTDTCSSPRQAVAVTINPAPAFEITNDKTVCNNEVTALTVTTGNNNYDNVTWSPATNLYTNAAATTAYVAGTHAATVYYKNGTAGTITYTANANNTTTNCANIDTVKIQTLPASITALATPGLVCESGTSLINYSPAITQTGFSQQWSSASDNSNFTDITGATGLAYTSPAINNTQYYRVSIKNSDGTVCMSSSDTVKVLHPQLTTVTPAERCGPGTLALTATAVDGQATWYESATSNTVLGTGSTFTTPNINTTTTYYVAAKSGIYDSVTVGNGTTVSSGFPNPFSKTWGGNRHQYLITAQELTAAGLTAGQIQGLALDIVAISTSGTVAQRTMNDLTIKLGNTTNTTMTGGFVATTSLQTVYNTAGYLPTATGWNYLNFANAYNWDGVSNIIVELTHNSGNSGGGGAHTIRLSPTSYEATFARWADNVTPATAAAFLVTTTTSGNSNSYSTRANMRFYLEKPCVSPRVPVVATVKDKPTAVLTPDGDIDLCEGETQTLTASGGGTYTWLNNNTIVPGQTGNTLTVTQPAPYTVVVTGANGCTDTSVAAHINIVPKPVVNLGNDTAVCANETLQLNAGNPGATYEWSNNSTAQTIDVNTAGQYAVTVTNDFDCIARDTITVTHLAFPVVNLGADTAICPSQPLTLNAENTGASYLWNDGSTTQTITVDQAGPYAVKVTNTANCVGTDTINVTLIPAIANHGFDFEPLFNIHPGRVKFTPVDLNPNYTYSWDFGDGGTSNQAIAEHDYATSGNYVVKLNVSDGCADSLETLEIKVDLFTSVNRVKKGDIAVKIYPNPTSNVLNIALESENTYIRQLSIFNLLGQQVATIIPENKNAKEQKVHLNNLASGAYLIKIETDKGTVNRKFEFIK
ncbi:MAG: T9SS type A sorting domain-containing protein [Taibaiella sp.]|nr:T9SS type A sorting domain-containing protein [Taibaiella sp.]